MKYVEALAKDGHIVKGTFFGCPNPKAVILLVHGITSDRTEWGFYKLLGPMLQKAGVSSLAIDLRGHGESNMNISKLSLSGVMLDLHAAWLKLESLAGSADTASKFILANSFGGGVSYIYGMNSKSIDHVFLTAPVLSYIRDIGDSAKSWSEEGEIGEFGYVKFRLSGLLIPEMYYFDEEIIRLESKKRFTIIHGEDDTDVLFELSRQFISTRENGDLIGLPAMDHCWAKTGDLPPFTQPQSIKNRETAAEVTLNTIMSVL